MCVPSIVKKIFQKWFWFFIDYHCKDCDSDNLTLSYKFVLHSLSQLCEKYFCRKSLGDFRSEEFVFSQFLNNYLSHYMSMQLIYTRTVSTVLGLFVIILNLVGSTRIWIVITHFRLIRHQTDFHFDVESIWKV